MDSIQIKLTNERVKKIKNYIPKHPNYIQFKKSGLEAANEEVKI